MFGKKRTYTGQEFYSPVIMRPEVRRGLHEPLTDYIVRFIEIRIIGVKFYLRAEDAEHILNEDGSVIYLFRGSFQRQSCGKD